MGKIASIANAVGTFFVGIAHLVSPGCDGETITPEPFDSKADLRSDSLVVGTDNRVRAYFTSLIDTSVHYAAEDTLPYLRQEMYGKEGTPAGDNRVELVFKLGPDGRYHLILLDPHHLAQISYATKDAEDEHFGQ